MRRPSPESRPRSLHCTQRKTGALKYAEKGATSRLERGVGVHPLVHGASTFPQQLPQPPCFGLILLALNPKVISKGQLMRASQLSGKERCFCREATGLWVSGPGLGFGGRGAGGWAGSRPWKCSDGPAAGHRTTALSSGEPFLPGRKHCIHSAPN